MTKMRNYGHITPEIRAEAVKAAREDTLSQAEVAKAFRITERALRRWIAAAEDEENAQPLSPDERAELKRLRRHAAKLEKENEILKKFGAFSEKDRK